MDQTPLIVGISGLRGIVGKSLTPPVAARYAHAIGSWLAGEVDGSPLVLVARDGRAGGEAIADPAVRGLLAAGCRVRSLGVATTPTAGVHCDLEQAHAAVVVTASHNPQEWNGLKLLIRREGWRGSPGSRHAASAPDDATARRIVAAFEAASDPAASGPPDVAGPDDVHTPHCRRVLDACARLWGTESFWGLFDRRPLHVVADSVNASGAPLLDAMFRDAPCRFTQLAGDGSGVFPHTPEPTRANLSVPGGLCDAVRDAGADVGLAQDPDADRLALVDERGRYIGEEYTLVLAAQAVLSAAPSGARPAIVANLSTSRMIDDLAARHGAEVVRTPVGEANVVARMKALDAEGRRVVLGGEGNGGVVWPDVVYVRDALSATALVLASMARTGLSLGALVDDLDRHAPSGSGYAIVKRTSAIASKADAIPIVERLAAAYQARDGAVVDRQDGVRVDWPERGVWVHVRASNTEPILRVIAEAPTSGDAERAARDAEQAIADR